MQMEKAVKESLLLSILNLNNDVLLPYTYLHSSLLFSFDFNCLFYYFYPCISQSDAQNIAILLGPMQMAFKKSTSF